VERAGGGARAVRAGRSRPGPPPRPGHHRHHHSSRVTSPRAAGRRARRPWPRGTGHP